MTVNRRAGSLKIATLVSLALGLTLTGCSIAPDKAQVTESPSVSATASATPSASPSVSVTPDPATPTETVESPAPEVAVVPETPVTPVTPVEPTVIQEIASPHTMILKTFTFPDGHISFDYPETWSVQLDESNGVSATVFDETGKKVAFTYSNNLGGAISGPVTRTLFDSEMMLNFPSEKGQASFAFSHEAYPGGDGSRYYMAVVPEMFLEEGESASATSFLIAPNGGAGAYVANESLQLGSFDEAKAWMETPEYKKLKSLLTSFRYA